MTFESSLPYLSIAAGLGAGVWTGTGSGRLTTFLASAALGALAMFAYFRWIAPTEAPLGLALGAAGLALRLRGGRAAGAMILLCAEWLVFAYLFLKTGDGGGALMSDGMRGALAAAVVIVTALALRRLWPALPRPRGLAVAEAAALVLMFATVLTLNWSFWPAMLGTAAVLAAEVLLLLVASDAVKDRAWIRRLAWGASYLGQAALAYAFLR